jgi:hypothetical protein
LDRFSHLEVALFFVTTLFSSFFILLCRPSSPLSLPFYCRGIFLPVSLLLVRSLFVADAAAAPVNLRSSRERPRVLHMGLRR